MPARPDRILLVEGREDREVIYQYCNHHQINNRDLFTVVAKDGYPSLRDDLSVRPLTGVDTVGAVVDANTDPAAKWQSVRDALIDCGYNGFPQTPTDGG